MKRDTIVRRMTLGLGEEVWGAEFSQCDLYRYVLTRIWDPSRPALVLILLNPSTATHEINDATITRCMVRAGRMGYGGLVILNAFAWRATDPEDMKAAAEPIGQYNDEVIVEYAANAPLVICGWGTHGGHLGRDAQVLTLLRSHGIVPWCLGLNADSSPRHPLYLPYETAVVEIPPKAVAPA